MTAITIEKQNELNSALSTGGVRDFSKFADAIQVGAFACVREQNSSTRRRRRRLLRVYCAHSQNTESRSKHSKWPPFIYVYKYEMKTCREESLKRMGNCSSVIVSRQESVRKKAKRFGFVLRTFFFSVAIFITQTHTVVEWHKVKVVAAQFKFF